MMALEMQVTANSQARYQKWDCVGQEHVLLPNWNGDLACMTFVDGTDNRVALDNQCGEEAKGIILQAFIDARTFATSALEWPRNNYGINATNMLFGRDAHHDTQFVQFASSTFQRVSMNDTSTFPRSPELLVFTCSNYPLCRPGYHDQPEAVAFTHIGHKIMIHFASSGDGPSRQTRGEIDYIQFCPRFFQRPTIQQRRSEYRSFWNGAPVLDDLRTGGTTILHELMHTRLTTDGQQLEDIKCANATVRAIDHGGTSMDHADTCAAMAELGSAEGGELNMTCWNAECFALSASGMSWTDHFGGHLPGDGRPGGRVGDLAASGLTGSLSDSGPLQLFIATLGWILILAIVCRVWAYVVRGAQWLDRSGKSEGIKCAE